MNKTTVKEKTVKEQWKKAWIVRFFKVGGLLRMLI